VREGLLRFVGEEGRKKREKLRPEDGEAHEHAGEAVELEALEREEQELAVLQINEMHPLAGARLATAFPVLCCCLRPCASKDVGIDPESKEGKQLTETARATDERLDRILTTAGAEPYEGTAYFRDMEKKFGLQRTSTRRSAKKSHEHGPAPDPLAEFGFGITSWLGTLRFLFWLYVVLSVFAGTIMMYYKSFGGLEAKPGLRGVTQFSLGNVGFTESLCFFQYADIKGERALQCRKGKLSHLRYLGMIADSSIDSKGKQIEWSK